MAESGHLDLAPAPFHAEVCNGETPASAFWTTASDGLRLRFAVWRAPEAKGTILLFPGRTEYVEKYSDPADEFAKRGLNTMAIDWRGQGLSDRMLDHPRIGHVECFVDYQDDVACLCAAAQALEMPKPYFILGHSMGGCIALRTVMTPDAFAAVAFTGPMWGIRIPPLLRPVAQIVKRLFPVIGLGHVTPPTTMPDPYVLRVPFENNTLTRDENEWNMMRAQIEAHPDLSLGGPSVIWLREALSECAELARMPSPDLPCLTLLGTNERIVHLGRIDERMDKWPGGRFERIENAEHEVMMEVPEIRTRAFDDLAAHFHAASGTSA